MLRLPKGFAAELMWDALDQAVAPSAPGERDLRHVLHQGLGPAMCENFYYPYCEALGAAARGACGHVGARAAFPAARSARS